jgi:phage-related tail fiber protein
MLDCITIKGYVVRKITYRDGRTENDFFCNTVLSAARIMGTASLVNKEPLYITHMLFGDGGCEKGQVKPVVSNQEWLYGVTRAKKEVVAQVNPEMPTEAIFTAALDYEDANGFNINEMGLLTNTGKLFCMATRPDQGKTEDMRIDWDWHVLFV